MSTCAHHRASQRNSSIVGYSPTRLSLDSATMTHISMYAHDAMRHTEQHQHTRSLLSRVYRRGVASARCTAVTTVIMSVCERDRDRDRETDVQLVYIYDTVCELVLHIAQKKLMEKVKPSESFWTLGTHFFPPPPMIVSHGRINIAYVRTRAF